MQTNLSPPASARLNCAYCGEPVPAQTGIAAPINGRMEPMCCHGCAAMVMLTGDGQRGTVVPTIHQRLAVEGLSCANCVKAIERSLQTSTGVASARVDPIAQEVDVAFDERLTSLATLKAILKRLGYGSALPAESEDLHAKARRQTLKGVLLAWFFMMQVMMLSGPTYFAAPGDIAPDLEQLMRVAEALLTLPVLIFCARPIFRSAVRDLRFAQVGADLPVALAILVAVAVSVEALARRQGAVYFDSVTMFLALLLTSRWLQQRGVSRAGSYLRTLSQHTLPLARRLGADGDITEVDANLLKKGDRILVRPGEVVLADATVEDGAGLCSEALITGESVPIHKGVGARVLAGSINIDTVYRMRVDRAGADTAQSAIARLACEASRSRPMALGFAERAAPYLLGLVLAVTLAAGAFWWHAGPARAIEVMLAVLVVTCPCALSLAAPTTFAASQAAMAARGVLVARLSAIETLAKVDAVVLDKTGTLTEGRMQLARVRVLRDGFSPEAVTKIAAALEQASNHPIAQAICAAQHTPVELAKKIRGTPGEGIEGELDGRTYRIGVVSYALHGITASGFTSRSPDASGTALLADNLGPLASFHFSDPLRLGAASFVATLEHLGKSVSILSGDLEAAVQDIAARLRIATAHGAMKPEHKKEYVTDMQASGEVVLMIGDGLNDAPVIAQADVSAAFASATTMAQTRADFIVLGNRFADLEAAMEIAAKTTHVMRQNLAWAFAYNLIAIPVAAAGAVSPLLAGIGMALSSLVVVGNALRLLPRAKLA